MNGRLERELWEYSEENFNHMAEMLKNADRHRHFWRNVAILGVAALFLGFWALKLAGAL